MSTTKTIENEVLNILLWQSSPSKDPSPTYNFKEQAHLFEVLSEKSEQPLFVHAYQPQQQLALQQINEEDTKFYKEFWAKKDAELVAMSEDARWKDFDGFFPSSPWSDSSATVPEVWLFPRSLGKIKHVGSFAREKWSL